MVKVVELETERLKLRQWKHSDYKPFSEMNADSEVLKYFPHTLSESESNALADKIESLIAKKGWGFWAVELKNSNDFIGFVGLHEPTDLPFTPCVEIGWRLAKQYWGNGYASEAAIASLAYATKVLKPAQVVSFTAVVNERSQAVMRKIGMYTDGYEFDHPKVPAGDQLCRHVLYKIDFY